MSWLPARAVLSFLALPGVVAFLAPWLILPGRVRDHPVHLLGVFIVALGLCLLLWCVGAFYHHGRGTLAPWDPPRRLVVDGLYRWSRNPMYLAVAFVLWGWALTFRLPALAIYAAVVMVAFHARVVISEEPWLARTFGDEWTRYNTRVPRWL